MTNTWDNDLRLISTELDHASLSWVIFCESTSNFDTIGQAEIVQGVNNLGVGSIFNHIQKTLLRDAVLTLCRIYDHSKKDRICLQSVVSEISLHSTRNNHPSVKLISSKMKEAKNSDGLKALKTFRDHYLGHNLRGDVAEVKYQLISDLIVHTDEVLDLLFEPPFGPGQRINKDIDFLNRKAKDFWSAFHEGAQSVFSAQQLELQKEYWKN